jgi:kinase-associated protein B
MTEHRIQLGDLVRASYKTGEYIGEIAELPGLRKVAVRILAITKHPTQGDLHHPMDPSVPFFHQRRALSEKEIALMPLDCIFPYQGEIPQYQLSLKDALHREIASMESLLSDPSYTQWAAKCLEQLKQLNEEYK